MRSSSIFRRRRKTFSSKVDLSKFCAFPAISLLFQVEGSFPAISRYLGHLPFPWRLSSIFLKIQNCFKLYWSRPTNVRKQVLLISSYFLTIPNGGICSRLSGGSAAAYLEDLQPLIWGSAAAYLVNSENKAKLSPAGAGAWAELGNRCPSKLVAL
jgi:hypothetical protein